MKKSWQICPNRFDTAEERRIHMRRCHKPDGFLMETALWEREKKDVPKSWRVAVERLEEAQERVGARRGALLLGAWQRQLLAAASGVATPTSTLSTSAGTTM